VVPFREVVPRLARSRLALGLVAAAALPGVAAARPVFTITGRGFGHGVGMPQYGARGAAEAGWDAPRILRYYFRGAQIGTISDGAVRVLLKAGAARTTVRSAGTWQAVDEATQPNTAIVLKPGAAYTVLPAPGGGLALATASGAPVKAYPGPMRLQPVSPAGVLSVDGARYRGAIRVLPAGGRVEVVDVVEIEQYLEGVVPREMPAQWGDTAPAALEAQAIAGRSYAVATLNPKAAFDLYPDDRSQVYGGVAAEDPRTTRAVQATRGQVLTYGGRVIVAYFFSSSGGRTEDVQNVFPKAAPEPYLTSVPDPFDRGSPFHSWRAPDRRVVTGAQLGRDLGLGGAVSALSVVQRGASPRVISMRVRTATGSQVDVTGARFRRALGLRDTWFYVHTSGAGSVPPSGPRRKPLPKKPPPAPPPATSPTPAPAPAVPPGSE
jgi:stage II sporulation protein D